MKKIISILLLTITIYSCNNNKTEGNTTTNSSSDNCSKYTGNWSIGNESLTIQENGNSFTVQYLKEYTSGGGMNMKDKDGFMCTCNNGVLQGNGETIGYEDGKVTFRGKQYSK